MASRDEGISSSASSERQIEPEEISHNNSNILDLPDETLKQIILLLTAWERIQLGNSCQRLNDLVFRDAELLRYLDFSERGSLTSAADVMQYFDNENTFKHILGINFQNVMCIKPGYVLDNSLGKAVNLVDIDIHGLAFKDIWQLGCFLKLLIHVQRLSIDWPRMKTTHTPLCLKVLREPFSRLVYLSVKMDINLLTVFISSLRLCQMLRELRMVAYMVTNIRNSNYMGIWGGEMRELKNLEIVGYRGPYAIKIKELFVTMLQHPENWTDFQNYADTGGFHLEKNVEVCEELLACKWTERLSKPEWNYFNLGWVLFPECLLREVLKTTYNDMPENFCCLSKFMDSKRCLLTIKDIKASPYSPNVCITGQSECALKGKIHWEICVLQYPLQPDQEIVTIVMFQSLLKDPSHQISYLYVNHDIEIDCDVHLLASAFSNLTELVLISTLTRNLDTLFTDRDADKRRRRRASQVYEENCESLNVDSSFNMLVQNTPHLRHFTLKGTLDRMDWNWDDLYLISNWKSLETLCLESIPMIDGNCLTEIGKQCKHLRILRLLDLGLEFGESGLFKMLQHCKNLVDFSIRNKRLDKAFELSNSLVNNIQLTTICLGNIPCSIACNDFIRSIKQLIRQCSKLTSLTCTFDGTTESYTSWLLAKKRLNEHFSYRNPKIEISFDNKMWTNGSRRLPYRI